ncbi:MAG: M14 family zinc carboxypeptidase [Candidatus Eiseniibacteriota bacterium]|jgi:hypothetical protein
MNRSVTSAALIILSCVAIALGVALVPTTAASETLRQLRITAPGAEVLAAELEAAGHDVLGGSVTATTLELIASVEETAALRATGLDVEVVSVGRPLVEILGGVGSGDQQLAIPPGYSDYQGIVDQMELYALASPVCAMVDLTTDLGMPSTYEGRHLYAVRISDNVAVDEDEPAYLMVGCHHAREVVTPVLALYAIEQLVTQYGSDPTITALVDAYEIWIAPCWNPDGYDHVYYVDNNWRKNRQPYPGGIGVDLNRNYPQGWSNPCSGSTLPSSLTYKGPSPASEVETQTLIALSLRERFAKVMDYHSSGREVLHGYACWSYPFDAYLESEATAISVAAGYGGDHRGPSADGEHYQWQFATQGSYAFLMETATQFQPSFASAQSEAQLVWPSTLYMLDLPIPLWGHVTDAVSGLPVEATIAYAGIAFQHDETNPSGGPDGRYHAFLPDGTYDVVFAADGYQTQTVENVVIDGASATRLDVAMVPESAGVELAGQPGDGGALLVRADPLARAITYQLARSAPVRLRIYDVRGGLVRVVIDDVQAAGRHTARWDGASYDGRPVASGHYYYQLRTDTGAATGKMLVVR